MNNEPTPTDLMVAILSSKEATEAGFIRVESRLARVEADVTSLRGQVSGLERRFDHMEHRVDSMELDVAEIKGWTRKADQRFDRLEATGSH